MFTVIIDGGNAHMKLTSMSQVDEFYRALNDLGHRVDVRYDPRLKKSFHDNPKPHKFTEIEAA